MMLVAKQIPGLSGLKTLICGALWFSASLAPLGAVPVVERISVDGADVSLQGKPEISSSAQKVVFYLQDDATQVLANFQRVRYKLKGIDANWKQSEGGSATFTVCFNDPAGTRFGHKTFEVKGVSPSWDKKLEQASFVHREELIMVPDNASTLCLIISSAGSPVSVGVYAVKNIRVTDLSRHIILDGLAAMPSRKGNSWWIADGTHRSMAQILGQAGDDILAIIDDDNTGHAEWRLAGQLPRVEAGRVLRVQWDESYETGVGTLRPVEYDRLAPGRYMFTAQSLDVWGDPVGKESSFVFWVSAPYWEKLWFWVLCVAAVNILILLLWRYRIYLKARRVDFLNQERLRIAQDLHDDLGSYITHISLLSAYAETQPSTPESLSSLREISKVTRSLVSALSETVWMVNPKNDNLESLVGFLCKNIEQQCAIAKVRCRMDALALTDYREVPSSVRHHVILAVKEALNNALKHSKTEELHARIFLQAPVLHIVIADCGQGFSVNEARQGNGLANMRRRMEEIGGSFSIESNAQTGTTVHFEVPIP